MEKAKLKKYDKEKIFKRVMAGALAGLMVLSLGITLIGCLLQK